jgi:hypothetical protein
MGEAMRLLVRLVCLLWLATAALPTAARADATQEDRDFLFRMGLLEGHLTVAHDLVAAHKAQLAIPHFGHPVRELYDDIGPYLKAHNFPPFKRELAGLEASATAAPYTKETEAKYQAVIATVHKARDLAPAELRASVPDMLKICAETIDAASGEYNGAIQRGKVTQLVEYHDSRGFISEVTRLVASMQAGADETQKALLDRFQVVLAKAESIVQPLLPEL